jgi:hypothetical protein
MGSDNQGPDKQYETTIQGLIEKGSTQGSKRSHEQAAALFNDFWLQLGMSLTDPAKAADEEIRIQSIRFLRDVVLPISWYAGKIKTAWTMRTAYMVGSAALIVLIPVGLAAISAWAKSENLGDAPLVVAQLTGALTGVIGLQRMIAATLTQQQRYGSWYKASSDLKQLWYALQSSWLNKGLSRNWPDQRAAFLADLADRVGQGRAIVNDEQADFFQKLTLPTVDLLDYVTKARSDSKALVDNFAPTLVGDATRAGELLKARQEVAKNDSLVRSINAEIDMKNESLKGLVDEKDKSAAKDAIAALQKARETAVVGKRNAEALVASLQVN